MTTAPTNLEVSTPSWVDYSHREIGSILEHGNIRLNLLPFSNGKWTLHINIQQLLSGGRVTTLFFDASNLQDAKEQALQELTNRIRTITEDWQAITRELGTHSYHL